MLTRREMIKLGLASAPALWYSGRMSALCQPPQGTACVPLFCKELPIPNAAPKIRDEFRKGKILDQAQREALARGVSISPDLRKCLVEHADFYDITMERALQPILPGEKTKIRGYNGMLPGPSIVAQRAEACGQGTPVVIRFTNNLNLPTATEFVQTVVHYHGGHAPSSFDGYPSDKFPKFPSDPSNSRVFLYPNTSSRAATFWYHDHAEDVTGRNVYMGLAGFFILTELNGFARPEMDVAKQHMPGAALPPDPITGLPPFDIPLVLQDRIFGVKDGKANQLIYPPFESDGVIGDTFLVNGAVQPFKAVQQLRYRLRFLNGSNTRGYQLAFSDNQTQAPLTEQFSFMQTHSDG